MFAIKLKRLSCRAPVSHQAEADRVARAPSVVPIAGRAAPASITRRRYMKFALDKSPQAA